MKTSLINLKCDICGKELIIKDTPVYGTNPQHGWFHITRNYSVGTLAINVKNEWDVCSFVCVKNFTFKDSR